MEVSIKYKNGEKDTVKVSVEYGDLWEMDVTLARVIFPVLKKYRKQYDRKNSFIGYPASFAPDSVRSVDPSDDDAQLAEWLICLDKMIYSFEWIAKNHSWDGPAEKEYFKECTRLLKPHKKELKKLAKMDEERFAALEDSGALNSLELDRYSEIIRLAIEAFREPSEQHRKKIQEGIDLFAKHYASLWI